MELVKQDSQEENLISNSELIERQAYYLSVLKSYLESQLEQVEQQLQNLNSEKS